MSGAGGAGGRGKKRRAQAPLEPDATLYANFSAAANSVTALFATAHAQGQRCYAAGARDFADRLLVWATAHEAGTGLSAVPTAQLIAALHAELEALEEAEMAAADAAAQQQQAGQQAPTGPGTRERGALSPLKAAPWGAYVDATGAAAAAGGAAVASGLGASVGGPFSR